MRKIQNDEDDEMFVISKSQKKKLNKKETKKQGKLKKLDNDQQYDQMQESSQHEFQSFFDEQKQNMKKNCSSKSLIIQNENPKSKQKLQQSKQVQEEEEENIHLKPVELPFTKETEEDLRKAELQLPSFIQPESIKDIEGRRPDDPNYDPSTLDIPIGQYQKLSPMFRQFWNAKKLHYDSLIFFRFGRGINVMYNDAIIIAKIFNRPLSFWGRHCPFMTVYESQILLYQRTLLEKGYKIMFVEQLEKADIANSKDGEVVKREITQLISRGTLQDLGDQDSYESKNLLVLACSIAPANLKGHKYIYGLSMVDCTTNNFYLDQFFDDEYLIN